MWSYLNDILLAPNPPQNSSISRLLAPQVSPLYYFNLLNLQEIEGFFFSTGFN